MKTPIVTAFAAGVLCTIALTLLLGANKARQNTQFPRYQITALGDNLIVLDNETNQASLLFKKRVEGKTPPDWPWATDNTFSVEKALHEPGGAAIQPAVGR